MRNLVKGGLILGATAGLLAPAATAGDIVAVAWSGTAYQVDSTTGIGVVLGPTGYSSINAMAKHPDGTLYALTAGGQLVSVDPTTGVGSLAATITGLTSPRGAGFATDGTLYIIDDLAFGTIDQLFKADVSGGAATLIGPTGLYGLQALAVDPTDGALYGWDCGNTGSNGVALCKINPATGAATDINPTTIGTASLSQALCFDGGQLYSGRYELYSIDKATDTWTLIGSGGAGWEARGMEFVGGGEPGEAIGFGDTGCPCGNNNDGTLPLGGCEHDETFNGNGAAGARLDATGSASVSSDSLVLVGTRGQVSNSTLFFQGNNVPPPGTFLGDGLQIAGGGVIRIQPRATDANGTASTNISISVKTGVSAGETKYYQWWIRDPNGSPCGNESNTSNGYKITWAP